MSIFSRIRDSFRKATSSNVAAADRNTSRNRDNPRTATGRLSTAVHVHLSVHCDIHKVDDVTT